MQTQLITDLDPVYPHPIRIEWKLIADHRCDNPALSARELATLVGRSVQTIYTWLKAPLYQSYENWVFAQKKQSWAPYERARRADLQEELQEFSGEMLDRLRCIAETTQDEKLMAQISQDWLDRAGHGSRREKSGPTAFILTEGAVRELLRRENESRGEILVGETISEP